MQSHRLHPADRGVSFFWICLALLLSLSLPTAAATAGSTPAGRERSSLDRGWRFALGHASDRALDHGHATGYFSYLAKTGFGDGPAHPAFDDRAWRLLDVPHDWAVEMPFDAKASHSHGYRAVGPGFPENSVGWYRRSFTIPASDLGRRIRLEFDGVYRAARVFVNGFYVGEEPSGYLAAVYDISDYLNYGGDNVVAVRVDASLEEGWYYEGAGIYRHVWLTKTEPLHVAQDGIWVRTEQAGADAVVIAEARLRNEGLKAAAFRLTQRVLGPDGSQLASAVLEAVSLEAGTEAAHTLRLPLVQPALWSIETPTLHTLVTELEQDGALIDRVTTRFGVRYLRFDPQAGFFLNGKKVVLKGTNNHQDHAGVGVAFPDALQDFRIRRLKEMGSNAYRCSHHPATRELLEACDRLGMLVINENRLMGSNPYHLDQLRRMMLRDRNHPSIILWSIGNEEWGIEGNIYGARITRTMQEYAKRIDNTRYITAAISGGWGGISSVIDAPGVNYIKQGDTDKQHAEYPWQFILGTEETTTQCTRGVYFDDRAACHLSPQVDGSSGGNAESGWRHYAARPWTGGVFFWTGFDYRGEPTPFGFPGIASQFGILDTCGFPKDGFWYLRAWWGTEPVLHLFPHWNWPGREGEAIPVKVHTNHEEVEIVLNGRVLGRQRVEPNTHVAWSVPYEPGRLVARGFRGGRLQGEAVVETTGPAVSLRLTPDRKVLKADGCDVAVFTVEALDAQGRAVPDAQVPVDFALSGSGRIIGVGNGNPSSLEADVFVEQVKSQRLGAWKAPEPGATPEALVFEADFDAPSLAPGGKLELLLNAIGPEQSVWLNGRELYMKRPAAQARVALTLEPGQLKTRGNRLRIEATATTGWGPREALGKIQPASLRSATPAAPWTRRLFNGLAQVIVQAGDRPETIVLKATSQGLQPATHPVILK